MRVRRKFIKLTRFTYPHGTESVLKAFLPNGYKKDEWGNFYYVIGDCPTSMFTCHLDTACVESRKVNHVYSEYIIRTDGKTILGADDKAGMVVILTMIERNVPGLYYFFLGEEVGCIGSGHVAKNWPLNPFSKTINKVVSFDRRDTCSVITHQLYGRCCSEDFAKELSNRLNVAGDIKLSPDDSGILTDSAQFVDLVPECTNISVGYNREHTTAEYQDIKYLNKLCKAVCKINWEDLPINRDPVDSFDDDFADDFAFCGEKVITKNYSKYEEWCSANYSFFIINDVTKKMYIASSRIKEERLMLLMWVASNPIYEGYSEDIVWNGNELYVEDSKGRLEYVGTRTSLMKFVKGISTVPTSKIAYDAYGKHKICLI
jgi:hypothetical protein